MSTQDKYAGADAAFIGTVESRRTSDESGAGRVVYTYVVEESFKRALGTRVEIATSTSDATCGYSAEKGTRMAMVLHDSARDADGRWSAGVCSVVDAEELRRSAKGEPAPPGPPPPSDPGPRPEDPKPVPPASSVRELVAGRFGDARLLLRDGDGATLARGLGRGRTVHMVTCSGGTRMAELALVDGRRRIVLRRLPSLTVVSSRSVRRSARSVRCVNGRAVASTVRRPGAGVVKVTTARAAARLCPDPR
jgi:hypothetical protein